VQSVRQQNLKLETRQLTCLTFLVLLSCVIIWSTAKPVSSVYEGAGGESGKHGIQW